MGRLSGFRYRQITKKLKAFGFEFFRNLTEAMKSGIIQQQANLLPSQITPAICLKERCVLF